MTNKNIHIQGFTLIETLIAIVVLMTAIVGPLAIASKGLQDTTIAKDQNTAFYLAQDAVEYVRWVRDTDSLNNTPDWLAALDGTSAAWSSGSPTTSGSGCTGSVGCTIDSISNTITPCTTVCPVLYYDPTNDHFTTNANSSSNTTATIFTRTIQIQTLASNSDEVSVTVTITWCDEASVCSVTPRSVSVREDIFNWQ